MVARSAALVRVVSSPRWLEVATAILVLVMALPSRPVAAQTPYQFTVIANNPGCPGGNQPAISVGAPALNDSGQVAFGVSTCSSPADAQVIRANVGEFTKIFGVQGQTTYGGLGELRVSMNANGTVAFYTFTGSDTAILTGSGGALATIADTTMNAEFAGVFKPSIRNSVTSVAFEASLTGQSGSTVIRESGGTFETVAGPGTVISVFGTLVTASQPTINGGGAVLFVASGDLGGGLAYELGGTTTVVSTASTGSVFAGFNNLNTASFDTGPNGSVYKGNGGTPTLRATAGAGDLTSLGGISSINDAGQIAFLAHIAAGPGIFTGPDAVADRVVATGDVIDGLGTVTFVDIGPEAMNNAGQIAFVAAYTAGPGVSGMAIVRADPLCARNISTTVTVSMGPLKLNRKTGRYTQTVVLKNTDGVASGPVSLVLDSLSNNATLLNATGTTTCSVPVGSPYINVDVGTGDLFSPRERASVTLEFDNPSGQPITYIPRILAESASR